MKIKKRHVSLAALTLIMTAGVASVSAYQGDYAKTGPNFTSERHEIIKVALNNNDYNSWKEQMSGKGRVVELINQDNFAKFAEAYKLSQAGDKAGADVIREELGLRTSNGEKIKAGRKGGNGNCGGQGQGVRSRNINQ